MIAAELRERVHVVNHFWLPDEAAWVYEKAAALFSGEMHSIIIALAAGTPSVLFRLQGTGDAADALAAGLDNGQHTMSDGLKGRMMEDLGLGDWLFYHSEHADEREVAERLVATQSIPAQTAETMAAFKTRLVQHQTQSMATVAGCLAAPAN
jgi:hypothetical protein